MVNNIQKRGTTFPILIRLQTKIDCNALMDTGMTRSCMNYTTAFKLGRDQIKQFNAMQVVRADGSDLGAIGTLKCRITVWDTELGMHDGTGLPLSRSLCYIYGSQALYNRC